MTASTASNIRSATGVRRLIGRRAIVALAIGASATLGLSACGAGQISQTANQASGVTGSEGSSGPLSVHDVQLVYPSQENASEQDQLNISFIAVNADPVNADTLESITVNGNEMTLLDGDFTMKPNSSISTPPLAAYLGGETEQTTTSAAATTTTESPTANAAEDAADGLPSEINVEAISDAKAGEIGSSVPVVFKFANADPIELSTPITVWHDVPRRSASNAPAPADD